MNVQSLRAVWQGKLHHPYGENAIIGTTAIALQNLGKAEAMDEALSWPERYGSNGIYNGFKWQGL